LLEDRDLLPELDGLISELSRDCESGVIYSREQLAKRVNFFFSPDMINCVDAVVPGWRAMIESDGGFTLVHILTALCALPFHELFLNAAPAHKSVITWAVMFHDIAKRSSKGHSDHTHGFRSAVQFVRSLPGMGVQLSEHSPNTVSGWTDLIQQAVMQHPEQAGQVQDNKKLAEILDGIEHLIPDNPSAVLVTKIVLLHHSITVLDEWPQANPLGDDEVRQHISGELLDLLEVMALVDNDGWELFDAENCERYRNMTRNEFVRLQSIIRS